MPWERTRSRKGDAFSGQDADHSFMDICEQEIDVPWVPVPNDEDLGADAAPFQPRFSFSRDYLRSLSVLLPAAPPRKSPAILPIQEIATYSRCSVCEHASSKLVRPLRPIHNACALALRCARFLPHKGFASSAIPSSTGPGSGLQSTRRIRHSPRFAAQIDGVSQARFLARDHSRRKWIPGENLRTRVWPSVQARFREAVSVVRKAMFGSSTRLRSAPCCHCPS